MCLYLSTFLKVPGPQSMHSTHMRLINPSQDGEPNIQRQEGRRHGVKIPTHVRGHEHGVVVVVVDRCIS